MSGNRKELAGFRTEVERVEYVPSSNAPEHRPHQFVYYITIYNDSMRNLKILRRKWVITNSLGHNLVVEGDGVVGQFPELSPGEKFHYNSYHLIDTNSKATGAYYAEDEDGNTVVARIETFEMRVPNQ